jgi:hypothetical protein
MRKPFIDSHLQQIHWTFPHPLGDTCYRYHKGLFMFHKNVSNSIRSIFPPAPNAANDSQQSSSIAPRLALVPPGGGSSAQKTPSPLFELIAISAHRCSSFFAEAAVLVLVLALLALLDRFMLKGRMEINWVLSAFTISFVLLAASVATDFSARRWLKAH